MNLAISEHLANIDKLRKDIDNLQAKNTQQVVLLNNTIAKLRTHVSDFSAESCKQAEIIRGQDKQIEELKANPQQTVVHFEKEQWETLRTFLKLASNPLINIPKDFYGETMGEAHKVYKQEESDPETPPKRTPLHHLEVHQITPGIKVRHACFRHADGRPLQGYVTQAYPSGQMLCDRRHGGPTVVVFAGGMEILSDTCAWDILPDPEQKSPPKKRKGYPLLSNLHPDTIIPGMKLQHKTLWKGDSPVRGKLGYYYSHGITVNGDHCAEPVVRVYCDFFDIDSPASDWLVISEIK